MEHCARTAEYQHNNLMPSVEDDEEFEKHLMAKKQDIEDMKAEYRKSEQFIEGLPTYGDARKYRSCKAKCDKGQFISAGNMGDAMYLMYNFPNLQIVKDLLPTMVRLVNEKPKVWKGKGNYLEVSAWRKMAFKFLSMCKNRFGIEYKKG